MFAIALIPVSKRDAPALCAELYRRFGVACVKIGLPSFESKTAGTCRLPLLFFEQTAKQGRDYGNARHNRYRLPLGAYTH